MVKQGFLYTEPKHKNAFNVFIETDCKTKSNSVVNRVKGICRLYTIEVDNSLDERIKARLTKGTLHHDGLNITFVSGNNSVELSDNVLIIQSLKEYKKGIAWFERKGKQVNIVVPCGLSGTDILYRSFDNIDDAMESLCELTKNRFNVVIHKKVDGKDYYAPMSTSFSLKDLRINLWRSRIEHEICVTAMVEWKGSNTSVRICTIKRGKILENPDISKEIALKNNTVYKNSILPEIVKAIKKVYRQR